jgi:hypothetical protein
MSFLSRLLGRRGGQSRSAAKLKAARENLAKARSAATASPELLVASLGETGQALERIFTRTRARAKRYPDIADLPDSMSMEERLLLRGNANAFGELPALQLYKAKRSISALGLSADAEQAAGLFVERFVCEGMGVEPEAEEEN